MKQTFLGICAISLLAGCSQQEAEKPNIIFILADDLSYRDLSCYGQQVYQTPNLDALAEKGLRFTQAYSAAPECAPSRGCLMTGLHTGHGPIRVNGSALGQHPLADSDITIAEVLKEAGYATAFLGKWGIGNPGSEGVPYKQGFDLAFGYYSQIRAHTYYPDYLMLNEEKLMYPENAGFDMLKRYNISATMHDSTFNTYDENGDIIIKELKDPKGGTYSENEIQKKALGFINENKENPFFVYYATQLPHGPVIIDNFSKMQHLTHIPQPNREWAAMVIKLDDFVGRLVDELKRLGIYENTIIFFASDNGYAHPGYFGRKTYPEWTDDPWFKNKGPFTGGKFSALEGGCRVPFFVSWQGKIKPSVSSEPVWLPDFFPTAARLAGMEVKHETDGVDLWPILSGKPEEFTPHEYMYFSKQREQAVRMGPWKAFRASPDEPMNLYLIEEDSYGERNLAPYYPEVVAKIEDIMDNSWTPHEWYWTPDETAEDYQKKVIKARETGQLIPFHRPNGLKKLPFENTVVR
ncbi:MAG: arylsulfatase [Bacteroidales bacterium]|nr:arylsulfatase [Bacteroidales bacterium]